MHWNAIEYAKGEGVIVGVHVQPGRSVRYYVQTSEGVHEYVASQIRREHTE